MIRLKNKKISSEKIYKSIRKIMNKIKMRIFQCQTQLKTMNPKIMIFQTLRIIKIMIKCQRLCRMMIDQIIIIQAQ
jgi:hypothetical protein